MDNWKDYNEKLVRRGEILISADVLQGWDKELAAMNHGKEDRKFLVPDSFMKIAGYARAYFGLPYRQTEGLLRTYDATIPRVPDYTAIHKRINRLDIKVKPGLGNDDDIVIAVDSTGIKVANRGEWMRDKWNRRRGFLKIHVGVDINSRKIVALKITDERSHDAKHLPSIAEQASRHGKVVKVLADAAYDSKNNFSYPYHDDSSCNQGKEELVHELQGLLPAQDGSHIAAYQLPVLEGRASYGKRWIVESVFSVLKRIFVEHVMAHKRQNMAKELELKMSLYNQFVSA